MTTPRYPDHLQVTQEDFRNSGWKDVIVELARSDYSAMQSGFAKAAKTAIEENRLAEGKVLWLLADAASMMLKSDCLNEPFAPSLIMGDRRSAIPEDLSQADLSFFAVILDDVDDARLRARLADILWLVHEPRDPQNALTAIDAYRLLPLDADQWYRDVDQCRHRALRLALQLGKGAGERVSKMRDEIINVIKEAQVEGRYFIFSLTDLLHHLQLGRDHLEFIADKLMALAEANQKLGQASNNQEDYERARQYFNRAAVWYRKANQPESSVQATVNEAEAFVSQGESRLNGPMASHAVACHFYDNAIQVYRKIPRSQRQTFNVDTRVSELRKMVNESGEQSLAEMGHFETEGIDIAETIRRAREMVQGKDLLEAVKSFASMYSVDVSRLKADAIKEVADNPLCQIFSRYYD